jgi:hypothetical protein
MSQTIISDSYAHYGTRVEGPPSKPEPPHEDPMADVETREQV